MAKLSYLDKKLLEELLGMASGYVLDFSDVTYGAFFRDLGIDIDQPRYSINGTSKAKRMRAFWEIATDLEVGKVLKQLFEYISATSPRGAGCTLDEKHHLIARRLLGEALKSKEPLNEEDFLAAEFGKLDLAALSLEVAIAETIQQRVDEINACLRGGAPLASILLAGSTLEALLLNAATKAPRAFNQATASPKDGAGTVKPFHAWSLNDLINVAHEVGAIQLDVKKFSHALRDFRNYIHPYEQAQSRFQPDSHTARISLQVLRAVIADLSGKR